MKKQVKNADRKDAIVALARKAGKTPEGLIEQALRAGAGSDPMEGKLLISHER